MSSPDDRFRAAASAEVRRFEMEGRSDRGKVRTNNEDCWALDVLRGLVVVADGVGGHSGGDVASELATRVILEALSGPGEGVPHQERIRVAVAEAHRQITETAQKLPHLTGMATTVVVGMFRGDRLHLAHVGDSRAYRISAQGLERLTRDHSLVEEMVKLGVFASVGEALDSGIPASMLTRGLGIDEAPTPDCAEIPVRASDIFLFCTDGLTGMLHDRALGAVLSDPSLGLAGKADQLVALALENGGLDNVTLVLARPIGTRGADVDAPGPRDE